MNIVYAVLLALAMPVFASSGDQDATFRHCVQLCNIQNCATPSTYSMPIFLILTCWTCDEDCKYACMHQVTDTHVKSGKPVEQYYGKWPFWRFAGVQEPASVVFSLLNLWFHLKGLEKIRRRIPDNHPIKAYYVRWAFLSMNSWIWSAVFHTRDRPTTEKLDYFSAALVIMYALYSTAVRIFHIPPRPLAAICTIVYVAHVAYLSLLPRFDYTYNMAFSLVLGMTHNLLWLIYSLPSSVSLIRRFPSRPKSYRPNFVSKAALLALLTTAASAFELFDFSPWLRLIDAHSLWHLATVPIVALWYDFLIEDSLDPSWREQKSFYS